MHYGVQNADYQAMKADGTDQNNDDTSSPLYEHCRNILEFTRHSFADLFSNTYPSLQGSKPDTTLFVKGFKRGTSAQDLRHEFERYGPLVSWDVPTTKDDSSPVEFEDRREAKAAYYELQRRKVDSYSLSIQARLASKFSFCYYYPIA
ncbi:hypothetical protein HK097_009236 [Rhizophlyctis rosea]|uniref:RRM domain-containing protein n=1 Tax=Rhizophlyctis rosea TaxID=64517 RepID=A0AAD5SHD4_9FUNG|nr:hypothetical protein HK097_009236 [Rhizophlyctis rosea]